MNKGKNRGTLYLHIGHHGTGSTALQVWLNTNRLRLLDHHQILYPDRLLFGNGHHQIGWSLSAKEPRASFSLSTILKELNLSTQLQSSDVILSSESFCKLSVVEVKKLADALKNLDVKIVFYLRHLIERIEVDYTHKVKYHASPYKMRKTYTKAAQLGDPFGLDLLTNRLESVTAWSKYFGKPNLIVRPYKKDELKDGDIISDFVYHLWPNVHKDLTNFQALGKAENKSPSSFRIEVLRRLNASRYWRKISSDYRRRMIKLIANDPSIKEPPGISFYDRGFIEDLMNLHGPEESYLANQFLPKLVDYYTLLPPRQYIDDLSPTEARRVERTLQETVLKYQQQKPKHILASDEFDKKRRQLVQKATRQKR